MNWRLLPPDPSARSGTFSSRMKGGFRVAANSFTPPKVSPDEPRESRKRFCKYSGREPKLSRELETRSSERVQNNLSNRKHWQCQHHFRP